MFKIVGTLAVGEILDTFQIFNVERTVTLKACCLAQNVADQLTSNVACKNMYGVSRVY